jgi:predicted nucleic acid-binding protein
MLLADTSVWIDYFNGAANKYTDTLDQALEQGVVAMGDLIFLEILQGFKTDKDYNLAKERLGTLEHHEIFGHEIALKSAENYRALRQKGIIIRRTADVIIATFCIENELPLLFSDRDFIPFVKHLGLQAVLPES